MTKLKELPPFYTKADRDTKVDLRLLRLENFAQDVEKEFERESRSNGKFEELSQKVKEISEWAVKKQMLEDFKKELLELQKQQFIQWRGEETSKEIEEIDNKEEVNPEGLLSLLANLFKRK